MNFHLLTEYMIKNNSKSLTHSMSISSGVAFPSTEKKTEQTQTYEYTL